ncbi:MAG: glycosyltransferase family 39 protein, partial [Gaiellaceae bacterium MAG52_C11]|nr:glycosyltransferase family 39 protein [Candidatus Gaiellasilicea maunaloa]
MTWRLGWAAELGGVALAAALLCSRGLDSGANYDEGVYLASADALGRGERLGEDVFASQPPGFYALVRLATALPGESVEAPRTLFVAVAVLGIVAAWSLGRTLAGRLGGLGAAGVLLTAPAYAAESARIAADTPSVALALCGLGLLAAATRGESWPLALAAGAVLAAAISVKLLVLTALVAAVGLLLALGGSRRLAGAFVGGGAAVTAGFLVVYAGALGSLYDDVVAFHTDARSAGDGLATNVERVARSFDLHAGGPHQGQGGHHRPARLARPAGAAADMRSDSPLILAVEDEARNVALLRAVLQPAGYRLAVVGSLADARAWIVEQDPDLL